MEIHDVRTISSWPAQKMAPFLRTRYKRTTFSGSLFALPCPCEIWPSPQTKNGWPLLASKPAALSSSGCRLTRISELVVKIVHVHDMSRVLYLRQQSKPVKHLSFHPNGSYIAVSCSDGLIYVYSLSKEEPELIRKIDGLIRGLETDVEASSKVAWHPDGRAFAAPTATRGIAGLSEC